MVYVRIKNVTCVTFLCCCAYLLYSGQKRAYIQDFTNDTATENLILKYSERNRTPIIKEIIRKDVGIENTMKRQDGCLVSTLDSETTIHYTDAVKRGRSLFFDRLSPKDKTEFRSLLKTFSKAVSFNITYFLYAGSLYGSYFHHGIVPWDDDVDIIVRDEDKPLLQKFLMHLRPEYGFFMGRKRNWKFYHTKSSKAGKKNWNWPFVDIFFYSEQGPFIVAGREMLQIFIKSDIFPLITRPFMDMMLPAPRETRKVLDQHYGYDLRICASNSFDHRLEKHIPKKCRSTLPCSLLTDKFPFVTRTKWNNISIEILENGRSDSK